MWVIIAFVVGVLLLCVEAFVPGGVMGVVGLVAIVTSMVLGFMNYGAGIGLVIFVGESVATVALVAMWLAVFPKTRIGKNMILHQNLSRDSGYTGQAAGLSGLDGKVGTAETDLRPAGLVRIEGRRIDAVTEGVFLEAGAPVKVVEVDGNRVVVRETAPAASPGAEQM